jgi:hypothetical protein
MQLGPTKGALHVGSHNTTLAGFGLNTEITASFHAEGKDAAKQAAPFGAARDFLSQFLPRNLSALSSAFAAVYEGVPWLKETSPSDEARGFLGSGVAGQSLWEKLRPRIPQRVDDALVVSPYFDEGLAFVDEIAGQLRPKRLVVVIDPENVSLDEARARKIKHVKFVNGSDQLKLPKRRESDRPFLHAKLLYFAGRGDELVVTGSANASAPAWLSPALTRNAEAVVWDRRKGVASSLGLASFFDAPVVTAAEWQRIREAKEAEIEDAPDDLRVLLAMPTDDGFAFDGDLPLSLPLAALDATGNACGEGSVEGRGVIRAPQATVDHAAELHGALAKSRVTLVVHRTEDINDLAASDSRKALRQAIGSLAEDPTQLEVLLRLTEKVIFDEKEDSTPTVLKKTDGDNDPPGSEAAPSTLAVSAHGKRGAARRRLVRGDLGYLIDLLIRSFEDGHSEVVAAEDEERGQSEDGDETSPGSLERESARGRDLEERVKIAHHCLKKTARLARRLGDRLDEAAEGGDRLVAQVAAVLNVFRVLRGLEARADWRQRGLELVDVQTLATAFEAIVAALATAGSALANAFGPPNASLADEVVQIVGLLMWLAYEADVDAVSEKPFGSVFDEQEFDEDRWYWVHLLVCIAPWFASCDQIRELARTAILNSGDADGERWFDAHARLLTAADRLRADAHGAAKSGPVKVGDLAVLGGGFEPRVRVIQQVTPTPRGPTITVTDFTAESGVRVFQRNFVACISLSNAKG